MTKLDSPNYTQIPNVILGDLDKGNVPIPGIMKKLKAAELKVLLVVCRLTFGYHQTERRASLTMISTMTGLARQSVISAAKDLEGAGYISREHDGGVTLWKVVVQNLDQGESGQGVQNLDQGVQNLDQGVQNLDSHLRKKPKKKPKKKIDDSNYAEIWADTQADLRTQMTQATFDATVRDTQLFRQNGHYTVGVDTELARDWLSHRLAPQVQRALAGVVGTEVEVDFKLLQDLNSE